MYKKQKNMIIYIENNKQIIYNYINGGNYEKKCYIKNNFNIISCAYAFLHDANPKS